jgi:hypothetical protein
MAVKRFASSDFDAKPYGSAGRKATKSEQREIRRIRRASDKHDQRRTFKREETW